MNLPEAITRKVAHTSLVASKNSPQILFGAGILGFVGTTVLACRATLKLDGVLNEAQSDQRIANAMDHEDYSERDRDRDIHIIKVKCGVEIARLYAPAVFLGAASIAALTKSHHILEDRNANLAAAYIALDRSFKEYRQRVVEKYGEEEDQYFRYDTEEVEIADEKTGKKKTVRRVGPNAHSQYARFFDELCDEWDREPEYNLNFLHCQQNYFNDMLRARGHLFLNEVYDRLGIPRSREGAVVGWVLTNDGSTDNYVDFGIWDDFASYKIRDFVNGREGAILLDFNVDGLIWDKIDLSPGEEDIRYELERGNNSE